MEKKKIIEIVLKTVLYAIGLLLSALGVSAALSACSVSHNAESAGKGTAVIHYVDTTVIYHGSTLHFPKIK